MKQDEMQKTLFGIPLPVPRKDWVKMIEDLISEKYEKRAHGLVRGELPTKPPEPPEGFKKYNHLYLKKYCGPTYKELDGDTKKLIDYYVIPLRLYLCINKSLPEDKIPPCQNMVDIDAGDNILIRINENRDGHSFYGPEAIELGAIWKRTPGRPVHDEIYRQMSIEVKPSRGSK